MKNIFLILFLLGYTLTGGAQSSINSGGTFQENDFGQQQFAIGEILLNVESEDEGYVLGGIQQIVLNAGDLTFFIDTTTVSLFDPESDLQLQVYPNPTVNQLVLQHEHASTLEYSLYHGSGKVLQTQNLPSGTTTIHLANYAKGLYYLRVQDTQTHQSVILSIVKQ